MGLIEIAEAYSQACEEIGKLIKASRYKVTWIMKEVGLGRAAFYARLNARNWEPKHLAVFGRILESGR